MLFKDDAVGFCGLFRTDANMKGAICIFLGIALSIAAQVSCWSGTYRAAVVEYNPIIGISPEASMNKNVAEYIKFMEQASKKGADIIVFPEGGLRTILTSPIPDPVDHIAPGDKESKFQTTEGVKSLSAAAKTYKIYTVVNLPEKRMCEPGDESCPSVGYYVFNTNVVFDRNGVVIARYAKYNLYSQEHADKPKDVELVFFDTDFGVRFGTFICFDILFSNPGQRLVQQFQITDFVFTTYWFSELPFLTALQVQRGWAETNNVNLLASGVNFPRSASYGSGIYNGKFGNLVEIMPEMETRKLLIADVPKIQNSSYDYCCRGEAFPAPMEGVDRPKPQIGALDTAADDPIKGDYLNDYKSDLITPGKTFEETICSSNNFCCDFKVTMDALLPQSKNYTYRAMVFNGVRLFGSDFRGGVQTCGVVACNGPYIANCTSRLKEIPGVFKFKEIKITGNFNRRNSLQIPSTLSDGKEMKPLSASKYQFVKKINEKGLEVSLELLWPVTDLHTFAIWGRDFTRDNEPVVPESSASAIVSMPILFTTFLGFLLFVR